MSNEPTDDLGRTNYEVANLYIKHKDFDKAIYHFKKAAEQGDYESQIQLLSLYLDKSDSCNMLYWYEKAMSNEPTDDLGRTNYEVANLYIQHKDFDRAIYYFKKAAEQHTFYSDKLKKAERFIIAKEHYDAYGDTTSSYIVGSYYYSQGLYEDALPYLRHSMYEHKMAAFFIGNIRMN